MNESIKLIDCLYKLRQENQQMTFNKKRKPAAIQILNERWVEFMFENRRINEAEIWLKFNFYLYNFWYY